MEFKIRASDEQRSAYPNASSNMSYFTEQALRAGYRGNDVGRGRGRANGFIQNPRDYREVIQREIEKERIREEIIAEEMFRRRVLEAEVRREMLMEREMALRRGQGVRALPPAPASSSMWFDRRLPNFPLPEGRFVEERLALSLEERLGSSTRRDIGGLEKLPFQRNGEPRITEIMEPKNSEIIPFQRRVEPKNSEMVPFRRMVEPKISEIKPHSDVSKEIIYLAKPDGNVSGVKRKAETSPAAGPSELPSVGPKKKIKEEWSCALCQVSATSEQGLNEHLRGKKHKNKEANLIAQRTGKNFTIGLFPKKISNPTKLAATSDNSNIEQGKKMGRESLQFNKSGEALLLRKSENIKKGISFLQHDADDSKKKNGDGVQKMQKYSDSKKKKFKFWCEMCQVGAFSGKVMEAHRKGKKHIGQLQELNQNAGAQMGQAAENKDAEVVIKEEEWGTSGLETGNCEAAVGVAACGTS